MTLSHSKKRMGTFFVLFTVSTFLVGFSYIFGFFDTAQNRIIDRFYVVQDVPKDIVIIAIDNESISSIGQWPWERSVFADLLLKLDTARIIGLDVSFSEASNRGDSDDKALETALENATPPIILPAQIEDRTEVLITPLPRFQEHSILGITNVMLDADGTARRVITKQQDISTFGVQLSNSDTVLPDMIRVNYVGSSKTITTIPAIDIIEGNLPERIIADKIVLIGATAPDLQDFVQTPFGRISGVEFHANVAHTLNQGNFFVETPLFLGLLLILLINAAVALVVFFVRKFAMLTLALILLLGALAIGTVVLFGFFIIIPILYLTLGAILIVGLLISFQYVSESKERQFIRKSFEYYLSPQIIDQIIEHPETLCLGGAKRNVSILFSDIRGYTTVSEGMTPEELVSFMNEYFACVSDIVMDSRGILDKYIGDAIMAFWGAPIVTDHHATDACATALLMLKSLEAQNEKWKARGLPDLSIGVGINTGDVVVGNMGSKRRFNYTGVGDNVNFTARLEGLNKMYGTTCIISDATQKAIMNDPRFFTRELDTVIVKGKNENRIIHELLREEPKGATMHMLEHFKKGKDYYTKGEWDKAIQTFETALAHREDGPSKVFLERCRTFKQNPPANLDGVYRFTTK